MKPMNEVRIVAELNALPGRAAELRAALEAMIAPTRAEPGCRQYDLHVDLADDHRFVFFERFDDLAAIEFHASSPHYLALGDAVEDLLAAPPRITRVRQIG